MLPLANLQGDPLVPMGDAVTTVRLVPNPEKIQRYFCILGVVLLFCFCFFFSSELLEHPAENPSTPVIFLSTVMA